SLVDDQVGFGIRARGYIDVLCSSVPRVGFYRNFNRFVNFSVVCNGNDGCLLEGVPGSGRSTIIRNHHGTKALVSAWHSFHGNAIMFETVTAGGVPVSRLSSPFGKSKPARRCRGVKRQSSSSPVRTGKSASW